MAIVGPTLCVKGAISIGDSVVLQLPLFDGACVEMARGVGRATSGGEE